jgi:hypothetical protein
VPKYPTHALVSTPCHLEPDVRFSRIRLSDNLSPGGVQGLGHFPPSNAPHHTRGDDVLLLAHSTSLRGSSCAVSVGVVGPAGHAPARSCSLDTIEVAALPYIELCCLDGRRYYGRLRLLTRLASEFRLISLYRSLQQVWAADRVRSLLFHRLLSQHPALPTPEGS